ncbi:arginase [Geodermatophilus bullaregiensis]|uniref:arginase family protein n=1 Tax=Geodermatophilus bullaregiensis TaxID=1564160 RepID=UPI001957FFDD|nr:arginase family protein [Geodermatophilus bullaregiensis]MBM7805358.1 arginase [Geodermatophilus bullaregiensis]
MTDAALPPVRLLYVPYDSGVHDARMGAGPLALRRAGAAARLRAGGSDVDEQVLEPTSAWRAEVQTAFELHRVVAGAVREARGDGRLPVLLAGNCNTTLGVLAGLSPPGRRVGLVWLDAHGDLNTPETTSTGFLDGQGLAMVLGWCWRTATSGVEGFVPLPEQQVVLVGARDLGTAEEAALRASGVRWLPPDGARRARVVAAALDDLAARVDVLHLHVDLDVHDPDAVAPANGYAVGDGLLAADVLRLVHRAAERLPVVSATLAAYDPAHDRAGRVQDTALDLLAHLADVGTGGEP